MDAKSLVAMALAAGLVALHLSKSGEAEAPPVDTQVVKQTPTHDENGELLLTGAELDRKKSEEFREKFRRQTLDSRVEREEKDLHKTISLLGTNPVEVSGMFGALDIQVAEDPSDTAPFLAEGGTYSGPTSEQKKRPSQLMEPEEKN